MIPLKEKLYGLMHQGNDFIERALIKTKIYEEKNE